MVYPYNGILHGNKENELSLHIKNGWFHRPNIDWKKPKRKIHTVFHLYEVKEHKRLTCG